MNNTNSIIDSFLSLVQNPDTRDLSQSLLLLQVVCFMAYYVLFPILSRVFVLFSWLYHYIKVWLSSSKTPADEVTVVRGFKRFDPQTGEERIWVRQPSGIISRLELGEYDCPLTRVQEMAVLGSSLQTAAFPKSVITLHSESGARIGMGCLVKIPGSKLSSSSNQPVLVTALHVLRLSPHSFNVSLNNKMVNVKMDPTKVFALSKKLDMIAVSIDPNVWSVLGARAARMGPEVNGAPTTLYGYNEFGAQSRSYGIIRKGARAFQVNHTASTQPGWSGTPIFSGDYVIALHLGAQPDSQDNYGSSFFFRRMIGLLSESDESNHSMYSEQSDTSRMSHFEDVLIDKKQRRLFSNKNSYSHDIVSGEYEGTWWEEIDDEMDFSQPPVFRETKPKLVVMESLKVPEDFLSGTPSNSLSGSQGGIYTAFPREQIQQSEKSPGSHMSQTLSSPPLQGKGSQSQRLSDNDLLNSKEFQIFKTVVSPKLRRSENYRASSTISKDSNPLNPLLRVLSRKELKKFQNCIQVQSFLNIFSGKKHASIQQANSSLQKFVESLIDELYPPQAQDTPIC